MTEDHSNLNPRGVLDAVGELLRRRRMVEIEELEMLAQWAAIHSGEVKGKGALIEVGGEGTPKVQTFCLGEIAIARETSIATTGLALADVLDLQYRLRKTWAVVKTGRVEVWIARRVAKMTRHLPLEKVGLVDRAVARMLGHESAGRILGVAEAKIIEADPDAHNARVEEERRRRYARLGRRDEYGLQTLIARIETADAVWIDATLARVAEILKPLHEDATTDELRAIAMGYLARPAELLVLLAEAAVKDEEANNSASDGETDTGTGAEDGSDETDAEPDDRNGVDTGDGEDRSSDQQNGGPGGGRHEGETGGRGQDGDDQGDNHRDRDDGADGSGSDDDPEPPPDPADDTHGPGTHLTRALAYPAELLDRLRDIDWSKLAPKAVLYLHLHEAALAGLNPNGDGDGGGHGCGDGDGSGDGGDSGGHGSGDGNSGGDAGPGTGPGAGGGPGPGSRTERVAGVVRGENGLGPHTLDQLHQMLKGTKVTVKPVIDLHDRVRTTAYEHPEAIKERAYLVTGGDYFPYASSTSRHVDYDHVRAFVKEALRRATGEANAPPPGEPQTGTDNCGLLGRRHHILKTFAGYRVCQIGPATYLWITPNGLIYVVDPSGTTRVDL